MIIEITYLHQQLKHVSHYQNNNYQIFEIHMHWGFPGGAEVKASLSNAGDLGLIPGSGRSLEKEMATHSSILAWRIPWTEELGGLQSTGRKESHAYIKEKNSGNCSSLKTISIRILKICYISFLP